MGEGPPIITCLSKAIQSILSELKATVAGAGYNLSHRSWILQVTGYSKKQQKILYLTPVWPGLVCFLGMFQHFRILSPYFPELIILGTWADLPYLQHVSLPSLSSEKLCCVKSAPLGKEDWALKGEWSRHYFTTISKHVIDRIAEWLWIDFYFIYDQKFSKIFYLGSGMSITYLHIFHSGLQSPLRKSEIWFK